MSFFCYSYPMKIRIFAMKASGKDFTDIRWDRYLSEERRAEAENRKNEKERQLFLAAEALLNLGLERAGTGVPLPVKYRRNPHGKPYLIPQGKAEVNWSHSGEYAICAVADCTVGIDIQDAGKEPKEALVKRLLRPEERAFYENVPAEEKKRIFYQYWTLKESFLKTLGTGFYTPLDTFYISMGKENPQIIQRVNGKHYGCRILDFADGNYEAAVCWEGGLEPGVIGIEYF